MEISIADMRKGEPMKYRTNDGVEFFVLPDGARCTYTKKHPDNMDTCPKDGGDICSRSIIWKLEIIYQNHWKIELFFDE